MIGEVGNNEYFDAIVVGTGFASTFFLYRFLQTHNSAKNILVLEAGSRFKHSDLVLNRHFLHEEADAHYTNNTSEKPWVFSRAFGGGSNCWYGSTPRMLPEDFVMRSKYGVGSDWPIGYSELEVYYGREFKLDIS